MAKTKSGKKAAAAKKPAEDSGSDIEIIADIEGEVTKTSGRSRGKAGGGGRGKPAASRVSKRETKTNKSTYKEDSDISDVEEMVVEKPVKQKKPQKIELAFSKSEKRDDDDSDVSTEESPEDVTEEPVVKKPAVAKKGKGKGKAPTTKKTPAAKKAVVEPEVEEAGSDNEQENAAVENDDKSEDKAGKKRGKRGRGRPTSIKKPKQDEEEEEDEGDSDTEYEVERILEVKYMRGNKREFLIKWKGFNINRSTWEPEENLAHSADLVEIFMAKVDKLRDVDPRQLRVERKQTQLYMDSNRNSGVRSSRRFTSKPRMTYHGLDD